MSILAHNRRNVDKVDKVVSTPPNSAARITLSNAPTQVASTKRAYTGIADYAQAHGLTAADYQRWQWQQATKAGRPALRFETKTGPRYRFLDGQSPSYIHETGYQRCLYGLDDATIAFINEGNPGVLCNGESSTVAAQTKLVPAFTITSGEKRIPQNLLDELTAAIPGASILIVNDCDPAGHKASAAQLSQLIAAGFKARAVDLGLSDGGDLADFCMLHGAAAYERLLECPSLAIPETAAPAFTPRVMPVRTSTPANLSSEAEAKGENWLNKSWDGIIRTVETATNERFNMAHWGAKRLLDLVEAGYRSESEARAAIENACEVNGYRAEHGRTAVTSQFNGALKVPRESVDMPEFHDKPKRQYSAGAEILDFSPEADTVHPDKAAGIVALLTDDMTKQSRNILGMALMKESQYPYSAHARDLLPRYFTLEDVRAAYKADGAEGEPSANLYTRMAKLGILKEVSHELFTEMHPFSSSLNGCKSMKNPKGGRPAAVYELVQIDAFKDLLFAPLARSFMTYHPETMLLIDEHLKPLMRHVLEGILTWRKRFEKLNASIVRSILKQADKHLADDVCKAIQALPITDNDLLAATRMGHEDYIEAVQKSLTQFDEEIADLITLKNRVVKRLYQQHKDDLDNPTTTPLPEGAARVGDAWLNAFYNALMMPFNDSTMWQHEVYAKLGIDNQRTAKDAMERAGIILKPRYDHARRFTVIDDEDCTPQWDTVQVKAKKAAKTGGESGRPLYVRSYDSAGRLLGGADVNGGEPEHWRFDPNGYFEVDVQLKYLVTVIESLQPAAPIEEDTDDAQDPIEPYDTEAMEPIAAFIAFVREIHRVARRRRRALYRKVSSPRVTPARLHDETWMLRRWLAPFCVNAKTGRFYNPLTSEIHETQKAAIDDLVSTVQRSQLKAAS